MFVGHPKGAILTAWVDGLEWKINPPFHCPCKKGNLDRLVVLIDRPRSPLSVDAGLALNKAGLLEVCDVLYGFEGDLDAQHHRNSHNGWRVKGLALGTNMTQSQKLCRKETS